MQLSRLRDSRMWDEDQAKRDTPTTVKPREIGHVCKAVPGNAMRVPPSTANLDPTRAAPYHVLRRNGDSCPCNFTSFKGQPVSVLTTLPIVSFLMPASLKSFLNLEAHTSACQ